MAESTDNTAFAKQITDSIQRADSKSRQSRLAFLLGDTAYFEREVAAPARAAMEEIYRDLNERDSEANHGDSAAADTG